MMQSTDLFVELNDKPVVNSLLIENQIQLNEIYEFGFLIIVESSVKSSAVWLQFLRNSSMTLSKTG